MHIENILQRLKIKSLNEMQLRTGKSLAFTDKDIVVLSETGSGKTLAYMLPIAGMLDEKSDDVQAVVIVPGRELALQSKEVFCNMGSGLKAVCLYGGRAAMDEHRELRKVKPQIVFATPGRLNDHLTKGNIDVRSIKILIIDEFDKCLRMGFRAEMSDVIGKMPGVKRRVLLSATDAEEIPDFINIHDYVRIDSISDKVVQDRISRFLVRSPNKDKLETLADLLYSLKDEKSIIFLNYRDSVDRVSSFLSEKGFIISNFHGGKEQKEREDAIYKFGNDSSNILVGTDLASRGLDIPGVDNVIHYHIPVGEDEYIHRVGRTARWDADGKAFFILGPEESVPEYVEGKVEEYNIPCVKQKPPLPRMVTLYIGKGKKDKISKGDILGFLCKVGGLKGDEIGRIDIKERCSYAAVSRNRWKDVVMKTAGEKLKGIKTVLELVK